MTDLLYVKQVVYDKGIRRGERHGAFKAKREMAKALKANGVDIGIIANSSGLSEDEIKAL